MTRSLRGEGELTTEGQPVTKLPKKTAKLCGRRRAQTSAQSDVENTIEDLTKELSRLINEAGTDGREELRDYAVSLLQGETETTQTEEPVGEDSAQPSSPFSPVALSIPFLLIGIILLPLFAPVGLMMLLWR